MVKTFNIIIWLIILYLNNKQHWATTEHNWNKIENFVETMLFCFKNGMDCHCVVKTEKYFYLLWSISSCVCKSLEIYLIFFKCPFIKKHSNSWSLAHQLSNWKTLICTNSDLSICCFSFIHCKFPLIHILNRTLQLYIENLQMELCKMNSCKVTWNWKAPLT